MAVGTPCTLYMSGLGATVPGICDCTGTCVNHTDVAPACGIKSTNGQRRHLTGILDGLKELQEFCAMYSSRTIINVDPAKPLIIKEAPDSDRLAHFKSFDVSSSTGGIPEAYLTEYASIKRSCTQVYFDAKDDTAWQTGSDGITWIRVTKYVPLDSYNPKGGTVYGWIPTVNTNMPQDRDGKYPLYVVYTENAASNGQLCTVAGGLHH